MVTLTQLWLPILLSGAAVFFLSFILWMVLPHHRSDWKGLPNEEALRAALKDAPKGDYMFPYCPSPENRRDEAFLQKWKEGPTGMVTLFAKGSWNMGQSLGQSFVFNLVVALATAYIATIGLGTDASGMDVFRLTATVTFLSYGAASIYDPIWRGRSWASTWKCVGDAIVQGLATGAVFLLLWPSA